MGRVLELRYLFRHFVVLMGSHTSDGRYQKRMSFKRAMMEVGVYPFVEGTELSTPERALLVNAIRTAVSSAACGFSALTDRLEK